MVYYFVCAKHADTMIWFLQTWGQEALRGAVKVVAYEQLPRITRLPRGAFILSDMERLTDSSRPIVQSLHDQLVAQGCPVYNNPATAKRRCELLTALKEHGVNDYGYVRADERGTGYRLPTFIRMADDHAGARTRLLVNEEEVEYALFEGVMAGADAHQLLIVEFAETKSHDGKYRKYSAFSLNGVIVPRHLIFSDNWMLKDVDQVDEQTIVEERAYLEANPHESLLREVFEIAQIQYGRVDYGVGQDGKVRIWEINTNPIVMQKPEKYKAIHMPNQQWFAPRFTAAIKALDVTLDGDATVDLDTRELI